MPFYQFISHSSLADYVSNQVPQNIIRPTRILCRNKRLKNVNISSGIWQSHLQPFENGIFDCIYENESAKYRTSNVVGLLIPYLLKRFVVSNLN